MQNILVVSKSPNWWVKIGDFGITKRVESNHTALRTQAGTQHFQAPEIIGYVEENEESSEYTNAVDVWSLGCVTFEILTHEVPFPDFRALSLFSKRRTQFPTEALSARCVSTEGIEFIRSLMVPEPSKRLTAETALQHPWLETAGRDLRMDVSSIRNLFQDYRFADKGPNQLRMDWRRLQN